MNTSLSKDAELANSNTIHPFNISFDYSDIISTQVICYNSPIITTQKQKLSLYDRELFDITFATSLYEVVIIGSKLPITIFLDHNSILFLFNRRGKRTPMQYKAQMILTKSFTSKH